MSGGSSSSISAGRWSSAECIVWERGSLWGVRLKRMLRDAAVAVHRCGSSAECWQRLDQRPASILLLEADQARVQQVFELVCGIQRWLPEARVLVVLPRGNEQQRWWLREVGAVHMAHSIRELPGVVRMVRRHVARARPVELPWIERIYAGLPWSA